jgi:hypothetical protein
MRVMKKGRSMVTDSGTIRPGYTLVTAVTGLWLFCISAIRCKTSIHVNHILATETHYREMYLEAGLFPEIFLKRTYFRETV